MEQIHYVICQFLSSTYDMEIILFCWLNLFVMEEYCHYCGDCLENDRSTEINLSLYILKRFLGIWSCLEFCFWRNTCLL